MFKFLSHPCRASVAEFVRAGSEGWHRFRYGLYCSYNRGKAGSRARISTWTQIGLPNINRRSCSGTALRSRSGTTLRPRSGTTLRSRFGTNSHGLLVGGGQRCTVACRIDVRFSANTQPQCTVHTAALGNNFTRPILALLIKVQALSHPHLALCYHNIVLCVCLHDPLSQYYSGQITSQLM